MILKLTEEYKVLDEIVDTIECKKIENNNFFDCNLYNNCGILLARYRHFTIETIPAHKIIREAGEENEQENE